MNSRGKLFCRNLRNVYLKKFLSAQGSLHNNGEIKMTKYMRVIRLSRTYEAIFHVIAYATQFFKFYRGFIPGRLPHGLSVVNTYKLRVHSSVDRAWLKPRLESVNGSRSKHSNVVCSPASTILVVRHHRSVSMPVHASLLCSLTACDYIENNYRSMWKERKEEHIHTHTFGSISTN